MNILNRRPEIDYAGAPESATKLTRDELLANLRQSNSEDPENFARELNNRFYRGLPFAKKLSAKNVLAIDIGSDKIHYIIGRKSGESIQVKNWGIEELPSEETDRYRSMEIALKYIQTHKYKSGMSVNVTFFSPDINVRQLVLPKLKSAELKKTILYKNKMDLPNFNEDFEWDFQILESFIEKDVEKVRTLVTVVPRDVIDIHLDILKRAGFKPDSLVPRPFALLSAYQKIVRTSGNDALIDIGYDTTQICFFMDGKLRFVRNFAIGKNNLSKAISVGSSPGNGNGQNNTQVESNSEMHAGDQVNTPQFSFNSASDNMRDRLLQKVQKLKSRQDPLLEVLLSEITRSLKFFSGSKNEFPISKVYISGAALQIEAVFPYLKNRINYPVILLTPFLSKTDGVPVEHAENLGALGAAIVSDRKYDMLPEEFRKKELFKNLNIVAVVLTIMSLAYFGYQTYLDQNQSKILDLRLSQLQQQYNALNPVEKIHREKLLEISALENEKAQLLNPINNVPEMIDVLKLFSNEVPGEIRLLNLDFNRYEVAESMKNRSGKAKTQNAEKFDYQITIKGEITGDYLMGDVTLINFINHLNDLKYFKKIQLQNKLKNSERKTFEFVLQTYL